MSEQQRSARRPVAFVTGSRRGLGAAMALELAEIGFDLVLNGRISDEKSDAVVEAVVERGARATYVAADIGVIENRHTLVDEVMSAFGTVDCVVNNAAVQVDVRGDMLEVTPHSYDNVMGVNARGTFFLTQEFARRMVEDARASDDQRRSIILVSSVNALLASPQHAEYCMSKTAISMFAQLLALRLAEHNIYVHEVRPGITRSDMSSTNAHIYDPLIESGYAIPMRRWGEASGVGKAVASLAAGAIPFSTGDVVHVDGGMHIPRFVLP
jgi:NAD(P)-dependent dehydrogenase (short-subunit alcohol dehydrogenase family)